MQPIQTPAGRGPALPGKKGLSTSGVTLMDAMDMTSTYTTNLGAAADPHEKPGYRLCSFVEKFMDTPAGPVPVIRTRLGPDDRMGAFLVRLGIRRNAYTVAPGLYAVGRPDEQSEVLVTANFKLSFDHLRKEISNLHAWILVLDTRGINVWCAAGKGTFSTTELIRRIRDTSLDKIVAHRRVIVPQLGATGVSAGLVRRRSGFKVVYGPIQAKDIRMFLKKGRKADPGMRRVGFTLYDRFILTPVELQNVLKPASICTLILFLVSGFGPGIFSLPNAAQRGMVSFYALLTGILTGAFVTPLLLPWIPYRSFALKGMIAGSVFSILFLLWNLSGIHTLTAGLALFLFSVTVSSYLAMNFTGATPFTSPSGVEKEMKRFIPIQAAALAMASGLWIYSAF